MQFPFKIFYRQELSEDERDEDEDSLKDLFSKFVVRIFNNRWRWCCGRINFRQKH